MEDITIWEQHTITLNKVSGYLFTNHILMFFISDVSDVKDTDVYSYHFLTCFMKFTRQTVQTRLVLFVPSGYTNKEVKGEF